MSSRHYNGAIGRYTVTDDLTGERSRSNLRSGVSSMMQAVKGLPMEKWLCWGSMGVAGLMLLLFILDLAFTIPFGGISKAVDILSII